MQIFVTNTVFAMDMTRINTKLILSVQFSVTTVTSDYCNLHHELNLTHATGYLASVVTSDTPSCVGTSHPWVIASLPGQRINLTLYDFALESRYSSVEINLSSQVLYITFTFGTIGGNK